MAVSVIIPAYRAAAGLQATVTAARTLPGVTEVVVVDDGSRDGTSDAARAAGADRVISLPRNLGKGGALREGVAAAAGDTLLFLDADLGASAAQAGPLLEVIAGRQAMSVAVFPAHAVRGGFGVTKGLAAAVVRLFTGLSVSAPLSGQRALPAQVARTVGMAARWGVEVGLTVEAFHLGVPVIEQPVSLEHHHTGRDVAGFRHRFAQFRGVLRYALGVGFGLTWPALIRAQVATRVALWLAGFAAVIALAYRAGVGWYLPFQGIVWTLLSLVLWLPCLWLTAVTLQCRKANYLGRRIPGGAGLLIPVVALLGVGLEMLDWVVHGYQWYWYPELDAYGLVLLVFGAVGLLDDLGAHRGGQARGLRGHFLALLHGRITTGAIKATAGLAGALAASVVFHHGTESLFLCVVDGLLIALAANSLNLLDLRPGRALKGFFVLAALALALVPPLPMLFLSLLAAALVCAPSDFAGRVMLGDTGANVLGAAAGLMLVFALPPFGRLAAVVVLAALHLYCERASLTDLIARHRVLRWLDALGTRHLPPLPAVHETRA